MSIKARGKGVEEALEYVESQRLPNMKRMRAFGEGGFAIVFCASGG